MCVRELGESWVRELGHAGCTPFPRIALTSLAMLCTLAMPPPAAAWLQAGRAMLNTKPQPYLARPSLSSATTRVMGSFAIAADEGRDLRARWQAAGLMTYNSGALLQRALWQHMQGAARGAVAASKHWAMGQAAASSAEVLAHLSRSGSMVPPLR